MFHLPPWGRWAMIGGGVSLVLLTAFVVICIVAPGCWFNNHFLNDDEERKRRAKEKEGKFFETQTLSMKLSSSSSQDSKDSVDRSDSILTQSSTSTSSQTKENEKRSFYSAETSSLLSSTHDSTYSSMSEYSGRSSPTISCQSSSVTSGVHSPTISEELQGQLTFGIQYIPNTHDVNIGKLVITVLDASGLSGKEYLGTACDPYVKVVVWKERRSLRKQKSPPMHVFRTRTVRHSRSPSFNQSFIMDVDKTQLKDLVTRLTVLDYDKWASPTTIGEVTQPLRDIKKLATMEQRTTLNYSLAPPKLDLGEVLFGLSYLPTAQRLSVTIIKANDLRYQNVVEELEDFNPFVKVMLISNSGRMLKKQKSSWRTGTASPAWNDTLIFDVTQAQMEHITFLLVLCSRSQLPLTPTSSEVSSQSIETLPDLSLSVDDTGYEPLKQDKYIGKVVLGCNVRGEDSRNHWTSIIANPRKVTSHWHNLK